MTISLLHSEASRHPLWPEVNDITTVVVRYPRFIHSELMTHRVFSRNASSSRAIPTKRVLKDILKDMAVPVEWGSNKPGMQAGKGLKGWCLRLTRAAWRTTGHLAVAGAWVAYKAGAHKQIVNRIVEPWSHITVIITSTEWENFFDLRIDPAADPTMRELALVIREGVHFPSKLKTLRFGGQHTPFSENGDAKQSVACCARVSYLNHDGTKPNYNKNIALHDDLKRMRHLSPFEHQAMADQKGAGGNGNLADGWTQYRSVIK